MTNKTRILIVEDDMIIAANISLQLTSLGYEVTGIETRGEDAIGHAKENMPDIILFDINLKGKLSGIEAAKTIQKEVDVAIIYLTANTDEDTFAKAKETHPLAFIPKPFNKLILERTIALAVEQLNNRQGESSRDQYNLKVLEDRVFVRHNGKMVKLLLADILYIEADRNYCNIVTVSGRYLVSCTLKIIGQELLNANFTRIHRSYIVNLSKLDVVAESHIEIKRKVIPLSKSYKEMLLRRLHTI